MAPPRSDEFRRRAARFWPESREALDLDPMDLDQLIWNVHRYVDRTVRVRDPRRTGTIQSECAAWPLYFLFRLDFIFKNNTNLQNS